MERALERAREAPAEDPAAAGLAAYLEHHLDEERGHDDWLLEDLEVLGVRARRSWRVRPRPCVAALVGAQYYWIEHYDPSRSSATSGCSRATRRRSPTWTS